MCDEGQAGEGRKSEEDSLGHVWFGWGCGCFDGCGGAASAFIAGGAEAGLGGPTSAASFGCEPHLLPPPRESSRSPRAYIVPPLPLKDGDDGGPYALLKCIRLLDTDRRPLVQIDGSFIASIDGEPAEAKVRRARTPLAGGGGLSA